MRHLQTVSGQRLNICHSVASRCGKLNIVCQKIVEIGERKVAPALHCASLRGEMNYSVKPPTALCLAKEGGDWWLNVASQKGISNEFMRRR